MENASKALLIAAAVLIAIIIITIGIKVYTSSNGTEKVAMQTGDTISTKTGDATDLAISEITGESSKSDPFNYGEGKTKDSVIPGNVITLTKDDVTESFTVISNNNGKIVAMPKYNITLTTNHPVQSSSAGTTTFSSENYWSQVEGWNAGSVNDVVDLDLTEKNSNGTYKNNIQQYIDAYKETLDDMGTKGIIVRAANKNELEVDGVINNWRNPGQTDDFWLSSVDSSSDKNVWIVSSNGSIPGTIAFNNQYRRCKTCYRN